MPRSALSRDRSTRRRRARRGCSLDRTLGREHRVRVHGIASGLRCSARCLPGSDRGRRSSRRPEWDFGHTGCRGAGDCRVQSYTGRDPPSACGGLGRRSCGVDAQEPAVGTEAAPAARRSTAEGKPAPAGAEQPTCVAVGMASRTGSSSVPADRVAPAARSAARSGPAAATGAI